MPAPRPLIRIALFRNDLRVHDQPLLHAAAASSPSHVLPLYCVDPRQFDCSPLGLGFAPATTWHFGLPRAAPFKTRFLVEAVQALQKELRTRKSDLLVRFGEPETVVKGLVEHLAREEGADVEVLCQREQTYEEERTERALARSCKLVLTDGGSTLVHPDDLPFKPADCPPVFTHFRKAVEGLAERMVRDALPTPTSLLPFPSSARSYMSAQDSDALLARLADTKTPYEPRSTIAYRGGEDTALSRLEHYCSGHDAPLFTYKHTRNSLSGTDDSSHFSPFLAVGALSARAVFWRVRAAEQARKGGGNEDSYWLLFELLWRDYWKHAARPGAPLSHNRLFRLFGTLSHPDDGDVRALEPGRGHKSLKGERPKREERKVEAREEWKTDRGMFKKWKEGTTGVPFVDANMRELAATGYMSNRGRQNVGSFLARQLGLDWRMGAEWFESALVDHDVCSNYGNWAYVAGVGTDPRSSRSFNVLKQAKDYDPAGEYVRLWCPELKDVPREHVHHPWTWKGTVAGYPARPMVMREEWRAQIQRVAGKGRTDGGGRGGGGRAPKGKEKGMGPKGGVKARQAEKEKDVGYV